METIETLRRRIDSVQDLHALVKTMKTLAAVNIRHYEEAVESLASYNLAVERGLQIVLKSVHAPVHVPEPPHDVPLGAIVLGSEQGMVGQFNDRITVFALEKMGRLTTPPEQRSCITLGMRVAGRLDDAGQPVESVLDVPNSIAGITGTVQALLLHIESWRVRGVERIMLFYNKTQSSSAYTPHLVRLLPVNTQWLRRLEGTPWPNHVLPTFSMEWEPLFAALIRQHLFASLYRAIAESLASENASRLIAMQAAEQNIEDRLEALWSNFRQQRQTSITSELLDVIAGFEALTGSA